ncbi:unnamed protein product, partial [Gongylonema pulchrum]|uniref:Uncharacterized protein n=1 Tax=Gongylonema pulchrum TaxID=637853 RepID=A0A183DBD4_9BILA
MPTPNNVKTNLRIRMGLMPHRRNRNLSLQYIAMLANPIEFKNQTQDDIANCTDSDRSLWEEHWATPATVSESAGYA